MKKLLPSIVLFAGFTLLPCASASILVEYPFVGPSGAPTNVVENLSAENAAWVGLSGTYGFGGGANTAFIQSNYAPSAFDENVYLTFSLSAAEGYFLDLESFQFQLGGSTGAFDLTVYAQVRSSVDGFTNSLLLTPGSTTVASRLVPATTAPIFSDFETSLGSSFSSLEEITFRIYPYNTAQTGTQTFLRLDTLVLSGAVVPIPEPSTVSLLLIVSGVAFALRCRKI